jgi:hypothetical protein
MILHRAICIKAISISKKGIAWTNLKQDPKQIERARTDRRRSEKNIDLFCLADKAKIATIEGISEKRGSQSEKSDGKRR